jgi:phage-related protein
MSFFRKLGRSIGSAFKSVPGVVTSIFKKAPGVINQISGGLGKVGDVLGKVADVGGKVLSNPITDIALTGLGSMIGQPELGALAGMAGKGLSYVKKGSQLAKGASNVVGARNVSDAIGGIQKLKDIESE